MRHRAADAGSSVPTEAELVAPASGLAVGEREVMRYVIGDVQVWVHQDHVATFLPCGRTLIALTDDESPESVARARALGYRGTDREAVLAMNQDHDLLHAVLAHARGHDVSPVLAAAACGTGCPTGDDEERIVLLLQRVMNVGRSVLDDFGA